VNYEKNLCYTKVIVLLNRYTKELAKHEQMGTNWTPMKTKLLCALPLLAVLSASADNHAGLPVLGGIETDAQAMMYDSPWFGDYQWNENLVFFDPSIALVDSAEFGWILFWGDWGWHVGAEGWMYWNEATHPWFYSNDAGWLHYEMPKSDNSQVGFWSNDAQAFAAVPRYSNLKYPLAGPAGPLDGGPDTLMGLRVAHASVVYDANPWTGVPFDFESDVATLKTIGEVTAQMPEATTAGTNPDLLMDGGAGSKDYPYLSNLKPIATVGEYDAKTGYVLTGWPDGDAAWLADEDTIRVAYQSESYARLSWETYPSTMKSGATFTGSKIHYIDYDRAKFADFLNHDGAASEMVEGSGLLYHTVYNAFGDEVLPKSAGGLWGNQALPDKTLVEFADDMRLTQADFYFHSFCSATLATPAQFGEGIGFEDYIWFCGEEWNIASMFGAGEDAFNTVLDTVGLASVAVDIANGVMYTVPAMGQSGYEKPVPLNTLHADYTALVLSGYNYDYSVAPLKIYIGVKGMDSDGTPIDANAPERDQFLARNGLLYGQIYGLAVEDSVLTGTLGIETIDLTAKMIDAYLLDENAPDTFSARFVASSYRWEGWDSTPAVRDTEVMRWESETAMPGWSWFNGDTKTEHGFYDPDETKARYVQNMTEEGGILGFDFIDITNELNAANGDLPEFVSVNVRRILGAWAGTLTVDVGNGGVKHDGVNTHATDRSHVHKSTAPDGLIWAKTADKDVLFIDEDSGNRYGERKYLIEIDPETMEMVEPGKGYFLAMSGGTDNPRFAALATVYGGTFGRYNRPPESSASTAEFSGTWNLTALVTKKQDGSFYSMAELEGTGKQDVNEMVTLNDSLFLGVVQQRTESGGPVNAFRADQGGQIFVFSTNIPE
jgi:hypothetical protein